VVRIDTTALLAEAPRTTTVSWDEDDVILYHLGIGAGSPAVDDNQLSYLLEDRLKVLPTYAVLKAFPLIFESLSESPALDVPLTAVLHAEQQIEVLAPLPGRADVMAEGRYTHVYDTGRNALLIHESVVSDPSGTPLVRCTSTTYVRGAGGNGGEPPPRSPSPQLAGPPVLDVTVATAPNQALLYRLTGDRHPLHADPEVARRAGFERPILHGLCTYGIGARALVDGVLDGDVGRLQHYQARFVDVVLPGDELQVRAWAEEPGRLAVDVFVPAREVCVMKGWAAHR
jgi:acyl dehydratase